MKKKVLLIPSAIVLLWNLLDSICSMGDYRWGYYRRMDYSTEIFWLFLLLVISGLVCLLILLFRKGDSKAATNAEAKLAKKSAPVKDARALGKIKEIAELHNAGALTDEEFQQKKADLLAKM